MGELATPAGLLLVGHGTRSPAGAGQFRALAATVASRLPDVAVQPAFLELQQPTIEQGIDRLAARGIRRAVVVPLLLSAAGHAKRDIPAAASAAFAARGMAAVQTAPLGCEAALLELSHRRVQEAVTGRLLVPAEETCLLLVGRGSRDETATAQMQEFAHLRQGMTGGMQVEVAFLAMARPSVTEQLQRIAALNFRRVIVQPHLLFQGELAASLEEEVAKIAAQNSLTEWLVTPLLADLAGREGIGSDILAEVVCARFGEASFRVAAPAGEH